VLTDGVLWALPGNCGGGMPARDRMSDHTTRRTTATTSTEGDIPMAATTTWTSDELSTIGAADELQIAPLRQDGSRRKPVTIWVVRQGDDLFVRSVNGPTATWFRGAQVRHEAHIHAGDLDKDVLLVETTDLSDAIDTAYRTKYRRYAADIVDSDLTPQARAATLKLVPRA
jgi:hypothetical protein